MRAYTADEIATMKEVLESDFENRDYFMDQARKRRDMLRETGQQDTELPDYLRPLNDPRTVRENVIMARHYNHLAIRTRSIIAELEPHVKQMA